MSEHRFIYWRNDLEARGGRRFANVHFLVGYNQGSLADFAKMAEELRKIVPHAKDDEIGCGTVQKSSFCKGFSIVTWNGYLPEGEYPDCSQVESSSDPKTGRVKGSPEYIW